MIVSSLESLMLRLLLGGAMDLAVRGQYALVREHVSAIIEWMKAPGVTAAAQVEIDAGEKIRIL